MIIKNIMLKEDLEMRMAPALWPVLPVFARLRVIIYLTESVFLRTVNFHIVDMILTIL